jgi:hypothetical protein
MHDLDAKVNQPHQSQGEYHPVRQKEKPVPESRFGNPAIDQGKLRQPFLEIGDPEPGTQNHRINEAVIMDTKLNQVKESSIGKGFFKQNSPL